MSKNPPLLRMHDLIVTLSQLPEDLDVLNVHCSEQLKGGLPVLLRLARLRRYLLMQQVPDGSLRLHPLTVVVTRNNGKMYDAYRHFLSA